MSKNVREDNYKEHMIKKQSRKVLNSFSNEDTTISEHLALLRSFNIACPDSACKKFLEEPMELVPSPRGFHYFFCKHCNSNFPTDLFIDIEDIWGSFKPFDMSIFDNREAIIFFKDALNTWGLDKQIVQAIQENLEISKVYTKFIQYDGLNYGNFVEEMADQIFLMYQMIFMVKHFPKQLGTEDYGDVIEDINHALKVNLIKTKIYLKKWKQEHKDE
jgi:hypothetical protein